MLGPDARVGVAGERPPALTLGAVHGDSRYAAVPTRGNWISSTAHLRQRTPNGAPPMAGPCGVRGVCRASISDGFRCDGVAAVDSIRSWAPSAARRRNRPFVRAHVRRRGGMERNRPDRAAGEMRIVRAIADVMSRADMGYTRRRPTGGQGVAGSNPVSPTEE